MAWIALFCQNKAIPEPQHAANSFSSLPTFLWKEVMLGPFSFYTKCGNLTVTVCVFLFQLPTSPENAANLYQPRELVSSATSRSRTEYGHPPALPFYYVAGGVPAVL